MLFLAVTALACHAPASIEVVPVGVVLDRAPVQVQARVLDSAGDPVESAFEASTTGGVAAIEGTSVRCVTRGDAMVTLTAGKAMATLPVVCRPDAEIEAPARLRLRVGESLPTPRVVDAGDAVDVDVALTSDDPTVVAADNGGLRGVSPGATTLRAKTGSLAKDIAVEVFEPLPSDRIYLAVQVGSEWGLVSVDGKGNVAHLSHLPGYVPSEQVPCERNVDVYVAHRACPRTFPVLVDRDGARVLFVRPAGDEAEVVVAEIPGDTRVVGSGMRRTAVGLVGGHVAWQAVDGSLVTDGGDALAALPEGSRFVGTDASGQPCAVVRKHTGDFGVHDQLWCVRDSAWVEQPRGGRMGFGALVDGGSASQWHAAEKHDCGLGACTPILPIDGVVSPWVARSRFPLAVTAAANGRVVGRSETVRFVCAVAGRNAALIEESVTVVGALNARRPLALSPDGTLLLGEYAYEHGGAGFEPGTWRISLFDDVLARQEGRRSKPIPMERVSEDLPNAVAVDWR